MNSLHGMGTPALTLVRDDDVGLRSPDRDRVNAERCRQLKVELARAALRHPAGRRPYSRYQVGTTAASAPARD